MPCSMPKRDKSGHSVKSTSNRKEESRPAVEAIQDDVAVQRTQNTDCPSNRLLGKIEAPRLVIDPMGKEATSPINLPERMEFDQLKISVNDLNQKFDEMKRRISALETQLKSSQSKKSVCQDCMADFVRMSVYVHGKKILLEYCPKCVPDPLVIMRD